MQQVEDTDNIQINPTFGSNDPYIFLEDTENIFQIAFQASSSSKNSEYNSSQCRRFIAKRSAGNTSIPVAKCPH